MISASLVCFPHTLHTAWQRTACCDDGSVLVNRFIDSSQCCSLCDLTICEFYELRNGSRISGLDDRFKVITCVFDSGQAVPLFVPCFFGSFDFSVVGRNISFGTQLLCQSFHCHFRVTDGFYSVHLVCMVSVVVDGHEFHVFISE